MTQHLSTSTLHNDEHILDKLEGIPTDFESPNWDSLEKVHEWKNHVSQEMQDIWQTFTRTQKGVIAQHAHYQASQEEWE